MSEKAINEAITEIYESIENTLPRRNAQVKRAAERARLLIADVLAKHTNADGVIPRNKVNAVLAELTQVESEIYRYTREELRLILGEYADQTTLTLMEALVTIYGATALAKAVGLDGSILAELGVGAAEALFSLMTETTYKKRRTSLVDSAFNRIGEDGKVLNDRLKSISLVIREEVSGILRESIRKGEGTSEILRKIDRKFGDLGWRMDAIVETESLYVMRQAVGKVAEDSRIVRAVRIVDYEHGDPLVHAKHRCHIYAQANEHGMGAGVYPTSTRKVRNPHPRCRSTLHFVMYDEFK